MSITKFGINQQSSGKEWQEMGTVATMVDMTFDVKLENLLRRRGLSQLDLARQLGVGKNTVNRWCSGSSVPDLKTGLAIARILEVDVEWLGDDEMEAMPPGLSDEEREILNAARVVTYPLALKRIMAAPTQSVGSDVVLRGVPSSARLIRPATDAGRAEDHQGSPDKTLT